MGQAAAEWDTGVTGATEGTALAAGKGEAEGAWATPPPTFGDNGEVVTDALLAAILGFNESASDVG